MNKQDPSFLEIDEYALDVEWVEQPKLYFEYATKLADANRRVDESKNDLEITEAECDAAIRDNPEKYDVSKITEPAVKAAIRQLGKYQKAVEVYNSAKHTRDVLRAAVEALDHRKKALENLVTLHGQSYFSEPKSKNMDPEKIANVKQRLAKQKGQRK